VSSRTHVTNRPIWLIIYRKFNITSLSEYPHYHPIRTMRDSPCSTWNLLKCVVLCLISHYFKILHNLTPFDPNLVFNNYTPPVSFRSNSTYRNQTKPPMLYYRLPSTDPLMHGTLYHLTFITLPLLCHSKLLLNKLILLTFLRGHR
jgi:hypothetical protein